MEPGRYLTHVSLQKKKKLNSGQLVVTLHEYVE